MNLPSPDAIARRFINLSHLIDDAEQGATDADKAAVDAQAAYRLAYARAFIQADGPVEMRKHLATIKAEPERYQWDLAEHEKRRAIDRTWTLKEQLKDAMALSALLRSEWNASGLGGA